jgi:4-alpha-glucanotransferase
VVDAALRHVGAAATALALLPVEDACALAEQPNLPGTVDGHPNWRRRLPAEADAIIDGTEARQRIAAFAASRHNHVKL